MALVFPWPPVATSAKMWNMTTPISKSYSMTSGKRFASAASTPRRKAKLTVYGRRNNGLGHMAALERLLQGGLNFVRLNSCRMAFGEVADFGREEPRSGGYFEWRRTQAPSTEFDWRDTNGEFRWFGGFSATSSLVSGSGGLSLLASGAFPAPGTVAALAGEFITVITAQAPDEGETRMISNNVIVREDGTALFKLVSPVTGPGRILLNASESGIFELDSDFPDLGRSGSEVPDISLEFREIFPGEVPEGLEEYNPWS